MHFKKLSCERAIARLESFQDGGVLVHRVAPAPFRAQRQCMVARVGRVAMPLDADSDFRVLP